MVYSISIFLLIAIEMVNSIFMDINKTYITNNFQSSCLL